MGERTENQTLHISYTTEESTLNKVTKLKIHLRTPGKQIKASNVHSKHDAFKHREERRQQKLPSKDL